MGGSSIALDVSAPTQDLKFMMASNVNVSNFVSIKLSGRSNYDIWKAQMLCLIKSQVLLHIIDAKNPFPEDKGVHMIEQYNQLVKGWIFGSVNEKVLKDLVDSGTAQEIWMKLESLFNPPVSNTEGDSSNTLDVIVPAAVSAIREDLKYIQALNADVSNFVSEKLSGSSNFHTWKTEMLYLIESHDLLHNIYAKARFPWDEGDPMTQRYDNLVKGWILSTMNDNVVNDFRMYGSVQLMWRNLEAIFTNSPPTTKDGSSNETDDLKYMQASNVNISEFVLVKLSGNSNYRIWKAQMLRLIESQDLLHLLRGKTLFRQDKYDDLVKGWIFDTMNDQLNQDYIADDYLENSANYLWGILESCLTDGDSWHEPVVSAIREDLKYIKASNVNVSNFVSVKLSGHNNYYIWKKRMLCLIESQELLHLINGKVDMAGNKYDNLVKGWIFSTMNEQLIEDFTDNDYSANYLWTELESTFTNPPESPSNREDDTSPGFEFRTEFPGVTEIEDPDNIRLKKELYEAAVEGCWWKAKSILKVHKNAATEAITENGNTILHLAVEMSHNYFLEKLLEFIKDGKDIETQNSMGQTALHIAAMIGNEYAAQLLVLKRKELLVILDSNNRSPGGCAFSNTKLNVSAYLLKSLLSSDLSSYPDAHQKHAIHPAIYVKQYDSARILLEKFPQAAREILLIKSIIITFPTDLGFMESLIYPSFRDVLQKMVVRGSLVLHSIFLDKCVDEILRVVKIYNNKCCSWLGKFSTILLVPIATLIYPTYQLICLLILVLRLPFSMLYFLMWKVLAIMVRPIKNIEKKKREYKEAKKILSLICNQMGTSKEAYSESIILAVRQDNYEVVDEILFRSPSAINCKDDKGHNIIQLAIINRSEKVYNLLYHIIECKLSYRRMKDSSKNNLVHLAARLAPSFVLERTTGAALQLQRELLWLEEVKKLLLPMELLQRNLNEQTPATVFTKEHQDLVKQGEIWMKTTAESCSITAALIVTVVFAAAITVPGGNNQESGIPVFKNEIAFTVFAVSNAFSLFTASTALLLFLSILTARFSERDFLLSLPRRLIFGLLMLFLSTTAMMVAFGAILFLVFCDQRPWMLAPICVFACMPISVIVTVKIPLLVDLIQSTYYPIFGKKSYLESCKVSRKNTIFTN